jgi:hypothetical protein
MPPYIPPESSAMPPYIPPESSVMPPYIAPESSVMPPYIPPESSVAPSFYIDPESTAVPSLYIAPVPSPYIPPAPSNVINNITNQIENIFSDPLNIDINKLNDICKNTNYSVIIKDIPDAVKMFIKTYYKLTDTKLPITIGTTKLINGVEELNINEIVNNSILVVPSLTPGSKIKIENITIYRNNKNQISINNRDWHSLNKEFTIGTKTFILSGIGSPVVFTVLPKKSMSSNIQTKSNLEKSSEKSYNIYVIIGIICILLIIGYVIYYVYFNTDNLPNELPQTNIPYYYPDSNIVSSDNDLY